MTSRRVRAWTAATAALLLADLVLVAHAGAAGPPAGSSPDRALAPAALAAPAPRAGAPAPGPVAAPTDTGAWGPVLDWGAQAKHMVTLSTGKVLVWSTGDNARVWDPAAGTFTLAPATFGDLHCAGQSTLADGRVIVVGGQNGAPHNGTNITSLFDPVTETWTRGRDMTDLRWYATSTTLADGRVLATSGDAPDGTRSQIPELYDPATDTWTRLTGAVRDQGLYPFMFVLPDGSTYEAGSKTTTASIDVSGTGSWTTGPTAPYATSGYSESAVMYRPGKILRAGGGDPAIAKATVIDMTAASPAWRAVAPMSYARRRMNLTLLADGTVMAIGGTASGDDASVAVLAGEIWDPATETWTTVAAMDEARMYHSSAVLLPDGRVVVGGGESAGRLRAQVYSPPYLFNGARPTVASAPATAGYGTTFTITSPEAASITSVALIRPAAATHAFDMNQRYVPVGFTRSGTTLTVSAPASGGVAPPGDYMLIVKDAIGVPSVASWLRVGTAGSLAPGSVNGRVTSAATGLPIAGAAVTSSAGSRTTDSQGRYSFSSIPAGEFAATFAASGYASETKTVQVSGGQAATLDLAMRIPGGIRGTVTNAATGSTLVGATVTYPGGVTTTGAGGSYAISGLPSGSTQLSFAATGFDGVSRTVIVPAGADAVEDVAMTPTATYVVGEVRDSVTTSVIAGASIAISTGQTTTTDTQGRYRVDLPPGSYTVSASAAGHVTASGPIVINGGSYATLDFALTPSGAGGATLAVVSGADTHAKSTSPTKNYGSLTSVRIRAGTSAADTFYTAYLRFDVAGLAGRAVSAATLRLYATDGGPHGGVLYRVGTGWTETGLTWANAPARSEPALATIGALGSGQWVDVPLPTGTISVDGSLAFSIVGGNSNSVYYGSREGANPPQLVLQLGATPTPTPSPAPTATPAPGGGARIKDITLEGGLLDPTTGFDSRTGTVTLETATPIGGTASARVGATTGYLQEDIAPTDDLYASYRLRVTAWPSGSPRVVMFSNAGTTTGSLLLLPGGRLRLRAGSTTVGVDSAVLQPGVTYLVGLHQRRGTGANGLLEAFLAADGAAFGAPFASLATGTWTTPADRLRIGATNGVVLDVTLDDVLLASGAMPTSPLAATGAILAAAAPGALAPVRVASGILPAPGTSPRRALLCWI